MRTLVSTFFTSLDGIVDTPQEWHFPYLNEEVMGVIGSTFAHCDALLLGRVTYQEWEAHWPQQSDDGGMADFINNTQKYVASTSLESTTWRNSTLLSGDLGGAVRELKQQSGGTIMVNGSGTLVSSLLQEGLVDELRLLVHPVVVGTGKHLFENGAEPLGMALEDVQRFGTGVLLLTYRLPLEDG
jgi:dihydrofolate reductase